MFLTNILLINFSGICVGSRDQRKLFWEKASKISHTKQRWLDNIDHEKATLIWFFTSRLPAITDSNSPFHSEYRSLTVFKPITANLRHKKRLWPWSFKHATAGWTCLLARQAWEKVRTECTLHYSLHCCEWIKLPSAPVFETMNDVWLMDPGFAPIFPNGLPSLSYVVPRCFCNDAAVSHQFRSLLLNRSIAFTV